ncbi:MAG: DUF4293 domain-containing protein [Saprospiraceae bacterium]
MIQRIQSIFLLLSAGASFGTLAAPFANAKATIASPIFADQVYNVQDNVVLLVLFAVAGALAVASIFLYKNRTVQMRLAIIALLINLAGLAFALIYLLQQVDFASIAIAVGIFLPLVAVIFLWLAQRNIKKDDKLVRSMDRLR